MPKPFVHLHLHTQYSLLDGAIKHNPLFDAAVLEETRLIGIPDRRFNLEEAQNLIPRLRKPSPCPRAQPAVVLTPEEVQIWSTNDRLS